MPDMPNSYDQSFLGQLARFLTPGGTIQGGNAVNQWPWTNTSFAFSPMDQDFQTSPGVDYAQQQMANANDAPSMASTLGMKAQKVKKAKQNQQGGQ
jgi:hypothetical protein